MKVHFLEKPSAEILQRKNVTTPATNKTPEDERRQNCQAKKDEARIHESLLQGVHRFRWLDGRNRFAHNPPLNDVRDHEQVQKDQRGCAPPTRLRFTNAGLTVAGNVDPNTGSPRNRSRCLQFLADATTFHKVREFTPKCDVCQRVARKRRLPGNQVRIRKKRENNARINPSISREHIPFRLRRGRVSEDDWQVEPSDHLRECGAPLSEL